MPARAPPAARRESPGSAHRRPAVRRAPYPATPLPAATSRRRHLVIAPIDIGRQPGKRLLQVGLARDLARHLIDMRLAQRKLVRHRRRRRQRGTLLCRTLGGQGHQQRPQPIIAAAPHRVLLAVFTAPGRGVVQRHAEERLRPHRAASSSPSTRQRRLSPPMSALTSSVLPAARRRHGRRSGIRRTASAQQRPTPAD